MSKKTLYIYTYSYLITKEEITLYNYEQKTFYIYIFLHTELSKYYEFTTSIFVNGYKLFYCI